MQADDSMQVYIGSGTSVRAVWDSSMEPWLASLVTVAVSRHGSVALVGSKWICYVNLGKVYLTDNRNFNTDFVIETFLAARRFHQRESTLLLMLASTMMEVFSTHGPLAVQMIAYMSGGLMRLLGTWSSPQTPKEAMHL